MKRNMDLIRELLLVIENHEHGFAPNEIVISGYNEEIIGYHLYLLLMAGLITGSDISTMDSDSPQAMASGLTWKGHEFLDAARSDTLWAKAKTTVQEKTGTVTLDLMFQYLQVLAKSTMGF